MTGGCTYPIYYQRVGSGDKGSVIIRSKKNKLAYQKMFLRKGSPGLSRPCVKHDRRTDLSDILPGSCYCRKRRCDNYLNLSKKFGREPSHVSSMTGGCTCAICHQRVVNVDKGSVIIRPNKNKLAYPIYYQRVVSIEKEE